MWRIVSDSAELVQPIRDHWSDRVYDSDALLGFQVTRPAEGGGILLLLSRWGRVLARSRNPVDILASLHHHLLAIDRQVPPDGSLRLELRAVRHRSGAVTLLGPEVGELEALPERRLQPLGIAIVDAPYVDVDKRTLRVVPISTQEEADAFASPPTHTIFTDGASITNLVWRNPDATDLQPTTALIAHALASRIRNGSLADRLELAVMIAGEVDVHFVDPNRASQIVSVLSQLG